jgi:hypothetical protein
VPATPRARDPMSVATEEQDCSLVGIQHRRRMVRPTCFPVKPQRVDARSREEARESCIDRSGSRVGSRSWPEAAANTTGVSPTPSSGVRAGQPGVRQQARLMSSEDKRDGRDRKSDRHNSGHRGGARLTSIP